MYKLVLFALTFWSKSTLVCVSWAIMLQYIFWPNMSKLRNQVQLLSYLANNLHVQINTVYLNILVKIYFHLCFLDKFVQIYASLHTLPQCGKNKEIKLVLLTVHFLNGLWILILITVPVVLKKYKNSIKNTLWKWQGCNTSPKLKKDRTFEYSCAKMEMFNAYSGSLKIK